MWWPLSYFPERIRFLAGLLWALFAQVGYAQSGWGTLELGAPARWVVDSLSPVSGPVRLRLPEGTYRLRALPPEPDLWGGYALWPQIRVRAGDTIRVAAPQVAYPPRAAPVPSVQEPSWIVEYTALGIAIGSGILSIHYKFRADRLDDRYRRTGDPELYRRIARLDRVAGAALLVSELALAVFSVRLLWCR